MNKLEFISQEKIIKLSFEDILFIINDDMFFYEDFINSLQGKKDNSFFNLRSINKNDFNVVEIDSDQNIGSELKYGAKSIIWKRINQICKDNNTELEKHLDVIKDEFYTIENIVNNGLQTHFELLHSEIELNQLLKAFYKPADIATNSITELQTFRYCYLFDYFQNTSNTFIVIKDKELEDDPLLLGEVLKIKRNFTNITICLCITNANVAYHFIDRYPLFVSSFQYRNYLSLIEEMKYFLEIENDFFESEMYFLLNVVANKRPIVYLENFKKLSNYEKYYLEYEKIKNFISSYIQQ